MFFRHFERSEGVTFPFSDLQISLVNGNRTDFYEGDLSESTKFLDYLGGGSKISMCLPLDIFTSSLVFTLLLNELKF